MTGGVVLQPGEGERHSLGVTSSTTIKAPAEATAGRFFLSENQLAPGFAGPPPHVHDELADSFYVLEGTLDLVVGEEHIALGAGGFGCVLPGTRHTFANRSESRVRFLNINAPGGFELYMRELADTARVEALTSQRIGEIAARYDVRVVD